MVPCASCRSIKKKSERDETKLLSSRITHSMVIIPIRASSDDTTTLTALQALSIKTPVRFLSAC